MCEIKIIGDEILMGGIKVGNLLPDILPSVRAKAVAKIDGVDAEKKWMNRVDELENDLRYTEIEKSDLEDDVSDLQEENKELRNALKTAKKYLEKVDSYYEGIADEADYFWKVKINELLKGGKE